MRNFGAAPTTRVRMEEERVCFTRYPSRTVPLPTEKGHFSYFIFEADNEGKIRDLFGPMNPEIRTLERWSDMMKAGR